jgi:acetyl esterase/lipase
MKMKKIFIFILLFGITVYGQKLEYNTKSNIPYYSDAINKTDAYINERCILDIYYPKKNSGLPTVVWFHGGGLSSGSKELPDEIKGKGVCVVSVNYRLSPKVSSPKYIEDAAAAVAWVFKNINTVGSDNSLVFISGHSTGEYLASMISLDKKWLLADGIDANKIAGIIPLSDQAVTHFEIRKGRGIPDTQPVIY